MLTHPKVDEQTHFHFTNAFSNPQPLSMDGKPDPNRFNFDIIRDHSLIQKAGSSLQVLESVLRAITTQTLEVNNSSLLKNLYYLLVYLSLDSVQVYSNSGSSSFLGFKTQYDYTVKFTDICEISNFLFTELSRRFEQLFLDLCDAPEKEGFERGPQHDLTLLLRCCLVILHLMELNQSLLLERCQTLLKILSILCSPDLMRGISCHTRVARTSSVTLERRLSCKLKYVGDGVTTVDECDAFTYSVEQSMSPVSVLCSILEVFLDELVLHSKLRRYFMTIDSISCATEKLFMCHFSHGDIDALLEVISAHFLLVNTDKHAFKKFPEILFWGHNENAVSLELSLTAVMQLLGLPVLFSAPHAFQAYVLCLVCRCIGIDMHLEDERVDPRVVNIYISAFERSFMLYTKHMSSLQMEGVPVRANGGSAFCDKASTSEGAFCSSFEYYIRPGTYRNINLKISSFANIRKHLSLKTKSDLVSLCKLYMKEKEHILENSHRNEILEALNLIISCALSGELEDIVLHKSGDVSEQEMYLLASIINLMSGSLLQTIRLMQNRSLGCRRILKDYLCCREYDFIIGIISCFQDKYASRKSQLLLTKMAGASSASHKESKLMVMHFAGLLQFSFNRGHEFLWKGCIFMMMTLMNLVIFEDGNIEEFKLIFDSLEESSRENKMAVICSPCLEQCTNSKVQVKRCSTLRIASKFQKIQMLYVRRDPCISDVIIETQCGLSETSVRSLLIKDAEEDGTCNDEAQCGLPEMSVSPLLIKGAKEEGICNWETHCGLSETSASALLVEDAEEEGTCNGESFILLRNKGKKTDDFDELADYIVCKRGKDYSSWLKDKEKYRTWKYKKRALLPWRERKRPWWLAERSRVFKSLLLE